MDDVRNDLSNRIKAAGRLNEITFNFKGLNTDELRVVTILRVMEMFETIPQAKCKMKNSNDSIDLRNTANKVFVSSKNNVNKLIKAWELYSKSIATAVDGSQELSLAYANRSAILLRLHKYAECIKDINRALNLEYPNHLRGKLLCRKIECLKRLDETELANDALDEATCWMERASLSNDDRETFQRKLNDLNDVSKIQSTFMKIKLKAPPKIVPNKSIPCASDALTVKSNEEFGRHVVTTRDIHPGEILVIEKPYSKILSLDQAYTHCSHCLQVRWAMVPCKFCIYAMYCSDECKTKAWREYHDVECHVTGYLVDLGFKKHNLFSMRLAIVALRRSRNVAGLKEHLRDTQGRENDQYLSDSYVNLYNLVTNTHKRSVSDLFERALNAGFVLYYLCTLTDLFGRQFNTDLKEIYMDEDVTFVGGLILRHMQIIPCNIHSYEEEHKIDVVDIGALALPFCSLINHSCDPNVSRCTAEDRMIVFAIAPIKKGDQIYDNYGTHYAIMTKTERENKLKQYYFDCNCEPCKYDWPVYSCLPTYTKLLTDKQVVRKIEKTLKKLDTYIDYAKEDLIDDKPYLISDLAKMIDTLVEHVPLPCYEVNNVVETLKRVFFLTYGNKFEVPKL